MVLSVEDATLPDVVAAHAMVNEVTDATYPRWDDFKQKRKINDHQGRVDKAKEASRSDRQRIFDAKRNLPEPMFSAEMCAARGILFFNTHTEFAENWWYNPHQIAAHLDAYLNYGTELGSGHFGSIKELKVVIADTEYSFAVKVMTDTSAFTQLVPTFNANLARCADVMPVFECGGPEPLPPVYHTVAGRIVGFMGMWDDAYNYVNANYANQAQNKKICEGLEHLRAKCAAHRDIALPDFKLENVGCNPVGNAIEFRLLDLDAILFMDTCFETRSRAIPLVRTILHMRHGKIDMDQYRYRDRSTKPYTNTTKLIPEYQAQFRYATTAQFFLCIASIAAQEPMQWDKGYRHILNFNDPKQPGKIPDPGVLLTLLVQLCNVWYAKARGPLGDPAWFTQLHALCETEAVAAKVAVDYNVPFKQNSFLHHIE